MKKCPRCHQNTLLEEEARNSLSRRDNKTYICPGCRNHEAYIDAGILKPNIIERNFLSSLKGSD